MQPISKSTIEKMKAEYEKTIRATSTAALKGRFPDRPWIEEAQSAWVSKKELLALLEDNNANGLRIHYGVHHESTSDAPANDYLGLHNVILVATVGTDALDSVDQLRDGLLSDGIGYNGHGGDLISLCPPNCP